MTRFLRFYYIRFICQISVPMLIFATIPADSSQGSLHPQALDGRSLFQSLLGSGCSVSCKNTTPRPVCGTNDFTYSSRCELKRAKKCDGVRVKVKHKGQCAVGTGQCHIDREKALDDIKRNGNTKIYVPTCKPDGSFNEVQCHLSINYCWCVYTNGKHITGSSTRGKRPTCPGRGRRRKGKRKRSKKRKRCSSKERSKFNKALIDVFKEEYQRVHPKRPGDNADDVTSEKAIVLWKFTELDINKDGILKFKELRNFGRIVKKLIKPRACAKMFVRSCDKRKDRKIEQTEWTLCLGVDIKPGQDGSAPTDGVRKRNPLGRIAKEIATLQTMKAPTLSPKLPPLSADVSASPSLLDAADNSDVSTDCRQQREEALGYDSRDPKAKHFVPECSPSGLWEKTQCHRAKGYCWCVEEISGNPVPSSAVYQSEPDCSFKNDRKMTGCPLAEKRRFLADLMRDLTEEWRNAMSNQTTSRVIQDKMAFYETVARWKIRLLDTNNNGVLERKEWKPMRRVTLKNKRYPRKCRRNFVRYCDEDNSKMITFEEWKSCLGLNERNFNNLPLNSERRGKNPFVDQLT